MTPTEEVGYMLNDCFLAVGQAIGTDRHLDFEALSWWHRRYRHAFLHAMIHTGNSWQTDRQRVTAVGRYLGQRALYHAGESPTIGVECAARASADVERGCQMNAAREGLSPAASSAPDVRTGPLRGLPPRFQ
jgi:hypothetical protein